MSVSPSRASVVSSFTIVKGSLIEETYTAFREWDFDVSRDENLRRLREANSIAATSQSWLRDIAKVLRRRFDPSGRDRSLVALAKARCSYEVWKPILLWHMTRDEFLVRDFLIHWLYPQRREGVLRVRPEDLHAYLKRLPDRGFVDEPWSPSTLARVAAGLLRIAADFDLLKGTHTRELASYHLPEQSFVYLLHAMSELQPNASEVVRSQDWAMYFMDAGDVERELFRLHQFRTVHYEVAGTIAQLSLPCASAAEYAKELAA